MKKISIIEKDNKVNLLFPKANKFLFDNFWDENSSLEELYLTHFKAQLIQQNNKYVEIIFPKDKDYTMFNLKFN